MEAPATARRLRLDRVLAALFAAALAFSFWTYQRLPATRPSAGDYVLAAAHIRAGFRAGDVVDLNPFWATRARELLGDLAMQQYRHIDREDLGRYRRVWLLSLLGAERRPEIERGLDARASLVEERRFGRIDVRLYELGDRPEVLFDFRDSLDKASVWFERGGLEIPCVRWVDERWMCPGESWNSVTRATLEIGEEPREVIWDHPVESGWKTLEWRHVPLGRRLVVRGGLRTSAARPELAPVLLEVLVDGQLAARWQYPSTPAFRRDEIDTSRWSEGWHRVAFRVTTPRQAQRHFGFSAEARK